MQKEWMDMTEEMQSIAMEVNEEPVYTERKRLLFFGLPWTFTKYIIKPSMLTIQDGLLKTEENDCYMYRIQDVKLVTTLAERIFGLGTVICYTGDVTNPEIHLVHIKKAKEIKNYILKEVILKDAHQAESIKFFNYPYAAVEELLANAVYHRSYQINEPITIKITPESMTIISFPGFDSSISDKDIANYDITSPVYRNRRIGDFLKELHLIEGRNTGYPTILKSLKENGSKYPIFKMDNNRTYLSVTLPIHPYFSSKNKISDKEQEYQNKVLNSLSGKTLSMNELAKEMGYKGISKKLSKTIEILTKTGKINKIVVGSYVKFQVNPN